MGTGDRPTPGDLEERSSAGLEVADKRVRGRVPYNVPSRDMGGWKEVIDPAAFRATDFTELRCVIDHKGVPLARYPTTLEIEDRVDGLAWSFAPPKSRPDVTEAIERGDMRAGSWRMVVAKDRWDGDVRHVEEISHLRDVTLVGAEEPAYPSAAVEYRTHNPAKGQEEHMADEANPTTTTDPGHVDVAEDRSNPAAGLQVRDRVEQPEETRTRSFVDEVADFSRDVRRGEVRSLTTVSPISNPEFSATFFDALRPLSAFIRSGARTLSTDRDSAIFPIVTGDPTVGWVAEGGTITASDPTIVSGTAVPHKLSVIVQYSNEVAEDSSPELEGVLRQVLLGRAAVSVDVAAYEGTGVSPQPLGFGNIGSLPTVNASTAATSAQWISSAMGTLEAANAPRPYAYVGGAALPKAMRSVRTDTGGTVGPFTFNPSDGALPTVWGANGYVANGLAGGTAYVYSPELCYLVNRTSGFDIEVDRSRLFNLDMSEMRLRARLDYLWVSSPFGGESRRLPGRRAGSGPRRPPPGPAGRTDVLGRAGQALQEDAAYGALRLAQRRGRERQRLRPVDPGVYGAPAHRELSAHRVLRKFRDASVAPKPAQLQAQRGRWSSISPPNRPERPTCSRMACRPPSAAPRSPRKPMPPPGERQLRDLASVYQRTEAEILRLLAQATSGDRRALLTQAVGLLADLRRLDHRAPITAAYQAEHPPGDPTRVHDLAASLQQRLRRATTTSTAGSNHAFRNITTDNTDDMTVRAITAHVDVRGTRWTIGHYSAMQATTLGRIATSRGVTDNAGPGNTVQIIVGGCGYCQGFEGEAIIGQDPMPPFHASCSCYADPITLVSVDGHEATPPPFFLNSKRGNR